ncbi:hypothetical protein Gohar_017550 [Gossypium harknessii]|uniref:Uncharacterized protein n=1 Tax=Gossypium harknessii TaxID=34285 RepID=A0A7J9G707_9ROSI|nr:hypothetical protein [Gossypium harknessii]
MDAIRRAEYHRMHPAKIFGHSEYMGRQCVVDSVHDGGDVRIKSSDARVRGKTDENWKDYHNENIDIWDRRIKLLPIHEPFFSLDMASYLEYMPWFRVAGKLYLLSVEEWSRQLHQKKPRQAA